MEIGNARPPSVTDEYKRNIPPVADHDFEFEAISPFGLLVKVPLEVREKIYAMVLRPVYKVRPSGRDSTWRIEASCHPGLLKTSRSIRDEILYCRLTFNYRFAYNGPDEYVWTTDDDRWTKDKRVLIPVCDSNF